MNLRNFLALLLLFIIASCTTDTEVLLRKTDVNDLGLKGDVQQRLEIIEKVQDSLPSILKETHRELLIFNKDGNIIEKKLLSTDGNWNRLFTSTYNEKALMMKMIEIKFPNDTLQSQTYLYDENGHQIKTIVQFPSQLKKEIIKEYDTLGNCTERRVYDTEGVLESKEVFIYDTDNHLIERKSYTGKQKITGKQVLEYNAAGKQTGYITYFRDSSFEKEVYVYNEQEERVKTIFYDKEGKVAATYRSEYQYDDENNLIKKQDFKNDTLVEVRTYKITYW